MEAIKINLKNTNYETIKKSANTIKNGGVIVYPTDTIYGLGANALDKKAVEKVFKIKQRDFSKPISIIIKDLKTANKFINLNTEIKTKLKKLFPGPFTVVLYKKDIIPDMLTSQTKKVGVRIPDCNFTKQLMEELDFPITTTSANVSGQEAPSNIEEIIEQFKNAQSKPDLILNAGAVENNSPSTVLDLTGPKPLVLRTGAISKEELDKILCRT